MRQEQKQTKCIELRGKRNKNDDDGRSSAARRPPLDEMNNMRVATDANSENSDNSDSNGLRSHNSNDNDQG